MAGVSTSGFTDDRFGQVADIFKANLESGADLGASCCVTVEGQTVVDIWGGWADEAKTRPWERDTLVNVWSTTKTMMALTALLVADRGELDFYAPVSKYWPEFAQNGKSGIQTSHFMSHSAGLSGWKEKMEPEDLYDWEKATARLAAQAPFWEPGTAPGYHGMTQGFLVGEVVRRITGRTLGTVFREEIAEPLGGDFYIGMPASEDRRVADLIPPPASPLESDTPPSEYMINVATNPAPDALATRTRAWRAAEIPAAGGQGNARSVAEIHVLLANGGVAKGKRILSEAGCRKALEPQVEGVDLVLGVPTKYGLGFGLPGPMHAMPNKNSLFWGGYGGSLIFIDMDAHTTFSYTMNKMQTTTVGDERSLAMVRAMWKTLGLSV